MGAHANMRGNMKKIAALIVALFAGVLFALVPGTASAATCNAGIGGTCGAYDWAGWPGSNGFNTYVVDQAINVQPGGTGSIAVNGPSDWATTANYNSCGGCVQTFNAVQQLTNNWGSGGWNGGNDTPVSALSKLQVTYTETSPAGSGNQYEFSPDVWTNYAGQQGGGSGDIMMWGDTSHQRCVGNGLSSSDILGQATISKQHWTVYRYGTAGAEIIFILDGTSSTNPVGTGTCATQKSGTFHVLSALKWLSKHNVAKFPAFANLTMDQLNTGWEITDGAGPGYSVTRLSYPVAVK